ncbi:hypothetical protein HNR49_002261 [Halobacterium salinarum]|uniref:Uncharacterized protein n=1 Tax=Halobacterium salinarum TaxID=2242 RepID=A0A841HFK5_HALSI|nr:hypothetical protein [Halobacterium salinarum]
MREAKYRVEQEMKVSYTNSIDQWGTPSVLFAAD